MILQTARLILRPFYAEDADAVMYFWGDARVMQFCGGAGSRERIEKVIAHYQNVQAEHGASVYAVVRKEDGCVIGACGFQKGENENELELIYHFAEPFWGCGYATEAVTACIAYAKELTGIVKIVASTAPDNAASQNVLEKLGFTFTGTKWFDDVAREDRSFELAL